MRKATLLIAVLFATASGGCGTEPEPSVATTARPESIDSGLGDAVTSAPATSAPAVSAPATAAPPGALPGTATPDPGSTGTPAAGPDRPMGSRQSIRTTAFDAQITMTPYVDPSPELGDAPYTVDVAVVVTRGSWEFGPARVRLIYAGGTAMGPITEAAAPADPTTLQSGSPATFRVPFEHPAGVGIGEGARITVTDAAGRPLATWLT